MINKATSKDIIAGRGKWDSDGLSQRFSATAARIETDLNGLQAKLSKNSFYKRDHDKQLGALQVYLRLHNSAALLSRAAFVHELQNMLKDRPLEVPVAAKFSTVIDGWRMAITGLLDEFSPHEKA